MDPKNKCKEGQIGPHLKMDKFGVCKFCGEEKKLIKAHIIPESFYFIDKTDPRPLKIISNVDGTFPKRAPTGLYDRTILCSGCDKFLGGEFDQYSKEKLFNSENFQRVEHENQLVCLISEKIDNFRLLKFIISLAWRASVSERTEFGRISLGPYNEVSIKALKGNREALKSFDALISSFWNEKPGTLNPHMTRFKGVRTAVIYAANFVFYLKLDKKAFGSEFFEFSLTNSPKTIIFNRSYLKSKERKLMEKIARKYPHLYS